MGLYLTKPNLQKQSDYQDCKNFKFAHTQIQGWRTKQDDIILINPNFDGKNSVFAIFEAQGSIQYANYLKTNFVDVLQKNQEFKNQNYEKALLQTYETIDKYLMTDEGQKVLKDQDSQEKIGVFGGCTALVVLLTQEEVFVANAGISRCVTKFKGQHKNMTTDHYAFVDKEKQRIIAASGEIWENRINAQNPVSRAFGHFDHKQNPYLDFSKQQIISQPDIRWVEIEECDFILIGSHGFWWKWTNSGITDIINERIEQGKPLQEITETCADLCYSNSVDQQEGLDNITCILIHFPKNKPQIQET